MNLCDINQLKALLARHGFHFSKSLGQNFLVQEWVPQRIAAECGADAESAVIEIGPGAGTLTRELSKTAGRVLCIELDRSLFPLLGESLADCENVELVHGDVLKTDIAALASEKLPGLRLVACANLPYYITTPAIAALLEAGCFEQITVMVQREVARRICAKPGSADYGAFTVFCDFHARIQTLFDVPPSCFMPQPKVTSTVVSLFPRSSPPVQTDSEELFFRCVKASFAQRRKTLQNGLASGFPELGREGAAQVLRECGLAEKVRGETLGTADFAAISNAVGKYIAKSKQS